MERRAMRQTPLIQSAGRCGLLLILLSVSGCEMGRSWFNMSSNSPMPWFGFELVPKRRTSQLTVPQPGDRDFQTRGADRAVTQAVSQQAPKERRWSHELRLPSVSPFFDGQNDEELSFTGPTSAFSR
jgi:hypothetical protein